MSFDLKLFPSLVDALAKIVVGLKTLVNLPREERDKYRHTLEETFRLLDTTMNMVIIRLGDILQKDDAALIAEAARLDNYAEWLTAEREFRLCQSLRTAVRETEDMATRLVGRFSAKDWETLLAQMRAILATEGEVALFIAEKFDALAAAARAAPGGPATAVREQAGALRQGLIKERRGLLQQEAELYSIV